jgi:hypothetical protein
MKSAAELAGVVIQGIIRHTMADPNQKSPGLSGTAFLLLLMIFVVRGVILLCVVPPFEGWDEYQHLGYIDYCAQYGKDPVLGEAQLDPAFSRAVARFPQPSAGTVFQTLGEFGIITYQEYWKSGPPTPSGSESRIPLYEAQHPPLYYRLMAPVYRWCGGRSNMGLAVAVLRGINVGLGALALACILWWIRRALAPAVGLPAGLCAIMHPLLMQDVVRVANDPLALLLGTVVIGAGLSLGRGRFWPPCLLIAAALPLGVLAKATDLTLLPAVLAAVAFCAWRREVTWKHAAGGALLIGAALGAIAGPYFVFNLRHFGVLTPMIEALANHQARRSFASVILAFPAGQWPGWTWRWWVRDFWTGGWTFLTPPKVLVTAHQLLVAALALAAAAALALKHARRRWPLPLGRVAGILVVLACINAGLIYHASASYSARGVVFTCAWYAAMGLPWLLILLAAGTVALIPRRSVATVLMTLLPGLYLVTEAYVLLARMIPAYGGGLSWKALQRLASLRPEWLGFPVFLGAQAVLAALLVGVARLIIQGARQAPSELSP